MAIILREAFRYQNFLEKMISDAEMALMVEDNYAKITCEHNRSKVLPDAKDEITNNSNEKTFDVSADCIIDFLVVLLKEKEKVFDAINKAKIQHCPNMDMELSLNKTRQKIVDRMKKLATLKSRQTIAKGIAYRFNDEGNQTEYYYDIVKTIEPDFDKNKLKEYINDISIKSDSMSTAIDYYLSSVPVNVELAFNINDSFEELLDKFAANKA